MPSVRPWPACERTPSLMLLDEIHLYTGTFGAQVAYLLRRWSHLTRRQTHFVGSSATIAEGAAFFASLVGLDQSVVEEISPNADHMVSEEQSTCSRCAAIPVSQTAMLSTSIQALTYASRLLTGASNSARTSARSQAGAVLPSPTN